jgi:drug/metabolite transporter (DMT)-like permease
MDRAHIAAGWGEQCALQRSLTCFQSIRNKFQVKESLVRRVIVPVSTAETTRRWTSVRVFLAFTAIYVLWGSTYLAIRVAVATVPPLFAAGVRFTVAGALLYLWSRLRGAPIPSRQEWRNVWTLGALMFLAAYSALFWAEETVPSGVASVLVATIPVWTVLLERSILKVQSSTWSLGAAIAAGLIGVAVLTIRPQGEPVSVIACLAITGGEIAWSAGTVLSKRMKMPESKVLSAGAQMLTGGFLLLTCSWLIGEMHPFPRISLAAAAAILYLTVAGSILAFTAYVWLLGRMPATKVASYAYVNPVIALAIGYWLSGETLRLRTVIGTCLILGSVVLILRMKSSNGGP